MKTVDDDFKLIKNGFIFESTGRRIYAHGRIIGISDDLGVREGYDGGLGGPEDFTSAEREELAEYMIGLWERFKTELPVVQHCR